MMLQPKINKSTHNAYITKIIFSQIKVFLRYLISKYFLGRDWNRDTKKINEIYDELRSKKRKRIDNYSLEEYVFSEDKIRWCILDNRLSFGAQQTIHQRKLDIIKHFIIIENFETIIELGSGDGRNILWLASRYPHINFIGFELSQSSVDLSVLASKKYGINNVRFIKADLTKRDTYEDFLKKDSFVFTNHTLEEMPRIFKHPLEVLKESDVKKIVLIEPAYIFSFSRIILDIARRIRIIYHDRLTGLIKYCKKNLSTTFKIDIIDLGLGVNPVNPSTLIILTRKK